MKKTQWIKQTIAAISSVSLIACGGGGSSNESELTASTQTISYPPNAEKLLSNATASSELYVEEQFKFNHDKVTQLNIQTNNDSNTGIPYARLNVYLLEPGTVDSAQDVWTDEMAENAQLLTVGQTNSQGFFTRIVEFAGMANDYPMLMVEVNALGIENKTLVNITGEHTTVTLGI